MIRLKEVDPKRASEIADAVQESIEDLSSWLPWATPRYSTESALEWANVIAPKGHTFMVLGQDGKFLGTVSINSIQEENRTGNIGYWVRTSETSKGVASAAVREIVSWVREHTNLNRLELVIAVSNHSSRKVAEKVGAHYEGVAKSKLLINRQFTDAAIYSITSSESGA